MRCGHFHPMYIWGMRPPLYDVLQSFSRFRKDDLVPMISIVRENTYKSGENKGEPNLRTVTRRPVNPSRAMRRVVYVVDVPYMLLKHRKLMLNFFQTTSLTGSSIHMLRTRPPYKLPLFLLILRQQTISTHHPFSLCCLTPILTPRAVRSVLPFWPASQSTLTVRPRWIIFRTNDSKAGVIIVQISSFMSPRDQDFRPSPSV